MESNSSFSCEGFTKLPFLCVFVTVIGVLSSLVVLWLIFSIIFTRKLWNASNFFQTNLFVTELLCFVSVVTVDLVHSRTQMLLFIASLAFFAAYFLNTAVIAVDRYFKTAKPLKYVRLVTNKVCASVIVSLWSLVIPGFIGVTIASLNDFNKDSFSSSDMLISTYSTKPAILLLIFQFPSLFTMTGFVVALVRLARSQQRKIAAEQITLGNIANGETEVKAVQPPRPRPTMLKSTWYMCCYFITFISAWTPNVIFHCVISFAGYEYTPPPLLGTITYIFVVISLLQMTFGSLFLVYTQNDHRMVLVAFCRALFNRFKRT